MLSHLAKYLAPAWHRHKRVIPLREQMKRVKREFLSAQKEKGRKEQEKLAYEFSSNAPGDRELFFGLITMHYSLQSGSGYSRLAKSYLIGNIVSEQRHCLGTIGLNS